MKQLRITDIPNEFNESDKIEITFDTGSGPVSCTIDYFHQGFEEALKNEFLWFYNDYMTSPYGEEHKRARYILEDIVKLGQAYGEHVFGNEEALKELTPAIRDAGFSNIQVILESSRFQFFFEPWEWLVFPGAAERMAIMCGGFSRTTGTVAGEAIELDCNKEKPVTILVVNPRPVDIASEIPASKLAGMLGQLLQYDGNIVVEFLPENSWQALNTRLADTGKPVHIIHYDGQKKVRDENNQLTFVFENENKNADYHAVDEFAKAIKDSGTLCVTLDCCPGSDDDKLTGESLNLLAAIELEQAGVPNVISMWQASCTYSTSKFFQLMYAQIAEENSLAKAVVKTGFYINDIHKQEKVSDQFKEYNDWPLALHFGRQDVSFFPESINNMTPLPQTQTYMDLRGSMFGFKEGYIFPQFFWGRYRELSAIENALHNDSIPVVSGTTGSGITHLLHHIAYWSLASGAFEKAFYFDYSIYPYDEPLINQVLGFATHRDNQNAENPDADLRNKKYLLILDNVFFPGDENEKTEKRKALAEYINNLSGGSVRVIISNDGEDGLVPENSSPVEMSGLGPQERRQLGSTILQASKLAYEEENSEYFELLDFLQGHPYITQTVIPQIKEKSVAEIKDEFGSQLRKYEVTDLATDKNSINALFEYGWQMIPEKWQPFFYPFAEFGGFISDALPIAVDMDNEDKASPGNELFSLLKMEKPESIAKVLQAGAYAGLFIQRPFGKVIHKSASEFIKEKRANDNWSEEVTAQSRIVMSKLFCYELRVLTPFVGQNPQPVLFQQIAESQNRWFNSLAVLWDSGEYRLFTNSLYLFRDILTRIGIINELHEWAFKNLQSIGTGILGNGGSKEMYISWLMLANEAVAANKATSSDVMANAAGFWGEWIAAEDDKDPVIYNYVLMFLESYHRTREDWTARKELGLKSFAYFEKQKAYDKMITALESVARSEEAMGNIEACIEYEEKVLRDLPYDEMEEGMRQKAHLDIALSRMRREDFSGSQQLLDTVREMPSLPGIDFNVTYLQGELYYTQEKFEDATAMYSSLWADVVNQQQQQATVETISKKLLELEEKLGKEVFENIFREHAPGKDTPSEMIAKQKEMAEKYKDGMPE